MEHMKSFWDHSTKPSTFVVLDGNKEIFRGPFNKGYEMINKQRSYKDEVSKFFSEPSCLTPKINGVQSKKLV